MTSLEWGIFLEKIVFRTFIEWMESGGHANVVLRGQGGCKFGPAAREEKR